MCAFLILRKPPTGAKPEDVGTAIGFLAEIGFSSIRELDLGHSWLWLGSGVNGKSELFESFGNGDFIAVSGTFFFKQHFDRAAVTAFLEQTRRSGKLSIENTHGCWTMLVSLNGMLHVLTDPSGLATTFISRGGDVIGSSFLAVSAVTPRPTLCDQNVYEYVFNGSILGNGTLFENITLLPMEGRIQIDSSGVRVEAPPVTVPSWRAYLRDELLEESLSRLRAGFRRFATAFGDNISCALSGGYDSRLILALLKEQGVDPFVFVYGRADDDDVWLAKAIAAGEGFPLEHIDKSAAPLIPPTEYAPQCRHNFFQSDGYTWEGLFTSDAEHQQRRRRTQGGRLYLNGGGGEVFRNFFYLPDRRYSVRQLMWTFYGQMDPAWCTGRFLERRYFAELESKVLDLLGRGESIDPDVRATKPSPVLERHEIEWLYPTFRCRSWVARENQLANWAGYQVNPFLDRDIVAWTAFIPIGMKNFGQFEAELIRRVSPKLASYPSAYGHDFLTPPPFKEQVKTTLGQARPPFLRRLSFRIKRRLGAEERRLYTTQDYVNAVFGEADFVTSALFRLDRIRDPDHWNRLLTVEYVARMLGAKVSSP